MTRLLTIYLSSLMFASCGKPELPDKENYFDIAIAFNDTSKNISNTFDRIYAISGSAEAEIKQTDSTIRIPLNLNASEVTCFFEKGLEKDSLRLDYELKIKSGNNEYHAKPQNIKITGGFRSAQVKCKGSSKKNDCSDAESVVIIFD